MSQTSSSKSDTLEEGLDVKRRPLKLSGAALAVMSLQTLGIVYSDLGTSPMFVVVWLARRFCIPIDYSCAFFRVRYTLNGIWPASGAAPSTEDVVGGLSAIFWALTIIPLIKYVRFMSFVFDINDNE